MGVRGIARWSNAPADGLEQVRESIRRHHEAKVLEPWTAHLRTVRRGQVTNADGTHASERLMWEYIHTAGDMLVIIDDPSAPKRAEFFANLVAIRAANASKPEAERQPEPHVPLHYRTTMITVGRPTIDLVLTHLGGAWHLNPPRPQQASGRPQQGIVHRAKISGELWQVGKDWRVRIGSVLGVNESFKGIIMEIEYLPVTVLPAEDGSSVFFDSFTMSLLPSLPAEALFNSVTLGDEEWMDLCGLDYSSDTDAGDVDVYAYGDNPDEKEDRTKDDWRRSAYLIIQCLKGEMFDQPLIPLASVLLLRFRKRNFLYFALPSLVRLSSQLDPDDYLRMTTVRAREDDELQDERTPKRLKLSEDEPHQADIIVSGATAGEGAQGQFHVYNLENLLPPSRELLGLPPTPQIPLDGVMHRTSEPDVGISEYIGKDLPTIQGIIKQRFTDFLVFEVDLNHTVTRLRCIERPVFSLETELVEEEPAAAVEEQWPTTFTTTLELFLSAERIEAVKSLYLGGPASLLSGNGQETPHESATLPKEGSSNRGGKAGRGRGKRGKPGKDNRPPQVVDNRQVISDPISSKDERAQLHKAVRELFKRQLETFTDESKASEEGGPRIVIKWAGAGDQRGHRRSAGDHGHQPFLHFTLQKTNRETSDALVHLSRLLKVEGRHLTVAGTKDKRGVTIQRVCLKRGQLTPESVWDRVNSVPRKSVLEAVSERGERGVRIGNIDYRKGHLQLGMLVGNAFVITLRNVKAESPEVIDEAMGVLKTKGFINYYGMQRFGTASVPTHAVGLALLRSDWKRAVDLILRPRPGEDPSVEAARRAWCDDKDLNRAISLMPRRAVAERALLEAFQLMASDRNLLGALSKIPRNLRTMYVHAYQSYVWNAIVSVRLKRYGSEAPVVGDLVYVVEEEKDAGETGKGKDPADLWSRKPKFKKVKPLTEEDVSKYTIFDVIMPLPGTDVAYPGGELGELYKEFLRRDGLDPTDFHRKQKEYVLAGSYRNILHLPKDVSWSLLRYTDPDLPLAQTDEDFLLGLEPPEIEEGGKFLALQIRFQLGTAAYATMALREITKVDTSSHVQTSLTVASEDQAFRGLSGTEVDETMAAAEDVGIDVGDNAVRE